MSKQLMDLDMGMPNLQEGSQEEKLGKISDFLFQLVEHQRYLFSNLDERNFNPDGLLKIGEVIRKPLEVKLENLDGDMTAFLVDYNGIKQQVADNQGNISTLTQTAGQIQQQVSDNEGNISAISQQVGTIETAVSNNKGQISAISQKLDSITLSVTNGETQSTIKLMAGGTEISSQKITLTGMVTLADLSGEGSTVINGSNITTGTLNAENIKINGKFAVYSGEKMGGYLGFMHGLAEQVTDGIGISDATGKCYLIATDSGIRLTAFGTSLYLSDAGGVDIESHVEIVGDLTVKGKVIADNV